MASIKKINDRKFKITVSNGYRSDGKKICKAKTICVPDSVRKSGIEQYVSHEAEEFEREVKYGFGEYGEATFEQYAGAWLIRQVQHARGTQAFYSRALKKIYTFIGKIKLCRLRPAAIENMLTELRKRKWHGKTISEVTVQKYLTAVSAVLSDAKRNEIIAKNPARMIDLPRVSRKAQIIPTYNEATRLVELILKEPANYKCYYLLAIYTGCRRGELCALKWSDFELEDRKGILTISCSRGAFPDCGVVEGPTKNGRSRTVAINTDVMVTLAGFYFKKKRGARAEGREISEYLFTNERGEPIHPDTFSKHLRKLLDKNNFPKEFHLHTLRHYFVSTMLHSGVDKQTVADMAGHCDTSFLERTYCHPQLELKKHAADIIGKSLCSCTDALNPLNSEGA